MELNGREIIFKYNVLASIEVAKLCPEGRLENIDKLFGTDSYMDDITNTNNFMIALHKGYIAAEKAKNPDFETTLLNEDELMLLSNADYLLLQNEAIKAYQEGNQRNVKTAPVKSSRGKGKKTKAAGSN